MLAKIVHAQELELSADEASQMAKATMRVAEFYDLRASEKAQAWMAFGIVCANIYYPRISAIVKRKRDEKQAAGPVIKQQREPAPAYA